MKSTRPDLPAAFAPAPALAEFLRAFFGVLRALRQPGDGGRPPKDVLKRHALAPRHLIVLAYLALAGPMSVSDLAGRMGVALTTASLQVGELATLGLVTRSEDTEDHRRTIVSVSLTNQSDIGRLLETRLAQLRRAAEQMGPERLAALTTGLGVLVAELAHQLPASAPGNGGSQQP